jgi:hypothetical protein
MSLDDFLGSVMLFASSTILSTRAVTWHGFAPAGLPVWDTPTFWTGYLIAGKLFISCIWNPLAFLPKWETFRIKRFHIAKWFQEEPWVETRVYENQYINQILAERCKQFILDNTSLVPLEPLRVSQRFHVKKTHQSSCPYPRFGTCNLSALYFDILWLNARLCPWHSFCWLERTWGAASTKK